MIDRLSHHIEVHLNAFASTARTTRWTVRDEDAPYEFVRRLLKRQFGPGKVRDWGDYEVGWSLHAAVLATNVSSQLLEGVLACLRTREVIFPLAPLVRSIAEHCGYAHWLLAPGEPHWTARDRVAQAKLAQIHDLTRTKSTAKVLKHPGLPRIGERLRDVRHQEVRDLFYDSEIDYTKSGDVVLRGRTFPGLSELTGWTARSHSSGYNTAGIYAILSNASHPTFSHFGSFVNVSPSGTTRWQMDDAEYLYRLTRAGLLTFDTTWQLVMAYLGREDEELEVLRLQRQFDADAWMRDLAPD